LLKIFEGLGGFLEFLVDVKLLGGFIEKYRSWGVFTIDEFRLPWLARIFEVN